MLIATRTLVRIKYIIKKKHKISKRFKVSADLFDFLNDYLYACIPGQTPQLLEQLNSMYFGFFSHSPFNAQDLQCWFLSSQADGKKSKAIYM